MCIPNFLSLIVRVVLVATLGASLGLAQLGGYAATPQAATTPAAAANPPKEAEKKEIQEEVGLNETQGKEVSELISRYVSGYAKKGEVSVAIDEALKYHLQEFHPQPKGWWQELKSEVVSYFSWATLGALVVLFLLALWAWRRGSKSSARPAIAFFILLAASSSMQAQVCWNTQTGKTAGAQKAAIAVLSVPNTFACSLAGKVIELVDDKGAVLMTPVIKNNNPLSFEFTPTAEGRAIIRIDNKTYGQVVIRTMAEAVLLNDAVDLVGGTRGAAAVGGDSDAKARLVLEVR
jgi:hypothetical protein